MNKEKKKLFEAAKAEIEQRLSRPFKPTEQKTSQERFDDNLTIMRVQRLLQSDAAAYWSLGADKLFARLLSEGCHVFVEPSST